MGTNKTTYTQAAFPYQFTLPNTGNQHEEGLTKREWMATILLGNLLVSDNITSIDALVTTAIETADKLLEKLWI